MWSEIMLNDKDMEAKLVVACQRVIRAIVTADEENADLIKADMKVIKEELIPAALKNKDEHIRVLARTLNINLERFGL
jgi:hypothetical protein